jgi:hypothetical protein
MKECRYCNKSYPESYFGVALTTDKKVYRRHKCKFCYLLVKRKLRKTRQEWLLNYKKNAKCDRCSIGDYRVLEFHHIDGKDKDFSIAVARNNNLSLDKIKQEIKKCVILCANCHRITHWEENGW